MIEILLHLHITNERIHSLKFATITSKSKLSITTDAPTQLAWCISKDSFLRWTTQLELIWLHNWIIVPFNSNTLRKQLRKTCTLCWLWSFEDFNAVALTRLQKEPTWNIFCSICKILQQATTWILVSKRKTTWILSNSRNLLVNTGLYICLSVSAIPFTKCARVLVVQQTTWHVKRIQQTLSFQLFSSLDSLDS